MNPLLLAKKKLLARPKTQALVRPTLLSVQRIDEHTGGDTTPWGFSGTADTSEATHGAYTNSALLLMLLAFDNTQLNAMAASSLSVGGSGVTALAGFINATTGARCLGTHASYQVNPTKSATLAISGTITANGAGAIRSGAAYIALFSNINQTTPFGTANQGNDTNGVEAFIEGSITAATDFEKLIGFYLSRGNTSGPHTTRNGSTIEAVYTTGGSASLDVATSVASDDAATGSNALGVTLNAASEEDRGWTVVGAKPV